MALALMSSALVSDGKERSHRLPEGNDLQMHIFPYHMQIEKTNWGSIQSQRAGPETNGPPRAYVFLCYAMTSGPGKSGNMIEGAFPK